MAEDLTGALWRKSTRSGGANTDCVEVAEGQGTVGVRDTKDRSGPHLAVDPADWLAFTRAVKSGDLAG